MSLKENPTLDGLKEALQRLRDHHLLPDSHSMNLSDLYISNELIRFILLKAGFTHLAINNFVIGNGWYDGVSATRQPDAIVLVFNKREKKSLQRYDRSGSLQEVHTPTHLGSTIIPITALLHILEQPGAKDTLFEGLIRLRIMHDMETLEQKVIPLLKQKGKGYFHLSVQTFMFGWKTLSTYFLLNPMHQEKYKHGWYTVRELLLWANDRGPVLAKSGS